MPDEVATTGGLASMTSEIQAIADRLEQVEKQNRTLKRVGIAILLIVSAVVLMGPARPPQTVTAQKFILADAEGTIRAELGISGERAHLFLYGTNQEIPQVSVFASSDGGGVTFSSADGYPRALLHTTKDGALLNLFEAEGKGRVHLGVGSFDLRKPDPGAKPSHYLIALEDVPGPSFQIEDKQGFIAVTGVVNEQTPQTGESRRTSAAAVRLFDKGGKELWSAP
jgi:hypothetical protein